MYRYTLTQDFADAVAAGLGMTAEPLNNDWHATLTSVIPTEHGKETRKIYLGTWTDKNGKVSLEGTSGSIGVNFNRGPEAVVREIERRLLTEENLIAESDEWKYNHAAAEAKRRHDALVERLMQQPGATKSWHGRVNGHVGETYWEAQVISGKSVEMALRHLTPEQAEAILALLAE